MVMSGGGADIPRGVGRPRRRMRREAGCRGRSTRGLRQAVHGCLLASTAGGVDCHSLRHLVAREPFVIDCCATRFPNRAPGVRPEHGSVRVSYPD
jgi:hypothetical protein